MGDIVDLDPVGTRWGHRLVALAGVARREVRVLYPDLADVTALVARVESAVRPCVTVRHLVSSDVCPAVGRQVRRQVADPLPTGLFVVDNDTALVLPVETLGAPVVLSDRGSVGLLWTFFERLWADASPYYHVGDGLSDQQVATVRLLADGHTDTAIAKRLGVSERTARRIVTRLMEMLGARGRFQAGVRAAEAGWLTNRPFDIRTDIRTDVSSDARTGIGRDIGTDVRTTG
jgi:DNA-binding CsgD family transcriptional regulator